MLPFRKILFPVDYSEPCRAIVPYVREMVNHYAGSLTLVHAYGPGALAYSELMAADPKWADEIRALEEDRLQKFAAEAFPSLHADLIVQDGEAGSVIDKAVQHHGGDLVMMPTHGYGPLRKFLLGSVTSKVLHDVSAAVWTGTGSALAGHEPGIPYKSILCALDHGAEASAVLKAAATLACSYKAKLFLLHAVAVPPAALDLDYSAYRKDLMDAADLQMRELKKSLNVEAPHKVVDWMVIDSIRREALEQKADLLVLGRGEAQGALSRVWSRLYPIVRESPCPVLSI